MEGKFLLLEGVLQVVKDMVSENQEKAVVQGQLKKKHPLRGLLNSYEALCGAENYLKVDK